MATYRVSVPSARDLLFVIVRSRKKERKKERKRDRKKEIKKRKRSLAEIEITQDCNNCGKLKENDRERYFVF